MNERKGRTPEEPTVEICPNCGTGSPGREFCLECGVKIGAHWAEEDLLDRELRSRAVYKAPDELSAVTLRKVLESEGIQAWIQSTQMPHDAIMNMVEGHWGNIMVFEDREEDARVAIENYLKSLGPGLH
jgi:hypothetical protein